MTWEERREWRRELRGAVYRKDGVGVVELLRADAEPLPVWQFIGDGVAVALAQRIDGAGQVAADCVAALRGRDWIGDVELAEQLDGLAGVGPMPLLRPLTVDLEQLCEILEGDPLTAGGALDLQTGEVWPRSVVEYAAEDGPDVEAPDLAGWTATHATATATWSTSSARSPTNASPIGSTPRSTAGAPSAASPTLSGTGPRTS